jgi:F-type H+-transporting ATPase subunit epsilon
MAQGDCILLRIMTPEKILVEKTVSKVSLPGSRSAFMVLRNHAPLITSLEKGQVKYVSEGTEESMSIASGFVEVNENVVTVCAEV